MVCASKDCMYSCSLESDGAMPMPRRARAGRAIVEMHCVHAWHVDLLMAGHIVVESIRVQQAAEWGALVG